MPSHKLLASYAKAIAFLLAIVLFHGCSPSVTEQSGVASLKVALKDPIVAPAARDKSTAPVAAAAAADDGDDILEMMTILTSVLTSPSGCAYNAQSCSVQGGLIINAGRCEQIGTSKLCMQTQGNLVLYASNGTALWASNGFQGFDATGYTGTTADLGNCTNCYAAFQGDGNLVLYNPSFNGNPYHAYWGSNTGGNSGAILTVSQNAPYLSIASAAGSLVWAPIAGGLVIKAGQCVPLGNLKLCMQTQGNLVLYASNGTALWASNGLQGFDATGYNGTTADLGNCTNCYAAFQGDGNLVLYNPSFNGNPYHAYWGSNTGGNSGAILTVSQAFPYLSIASAAGSLVWAPIAGGLVIKAGQCVPLGTLKLCMQTQGNLVLYASNGTALWATNMLQSYDAAGYYGTTADFGNCTNCYAAFQGDGNLVLYNPSFNGNPNHAYWASGTSSTGATLVISQNAPYVSIVNTSNVLWDPPGFACTPVQYGLFNQQGTPFNFLSQSVCDDGHGHLLPNDPGPGGAGCPCGSGNARSLKIGEALPYHKTDQNNAQISDTFPIADPNGRTRAIHSMFYADTLVNGQVVFNYQAPPYHGGYDVIGADGNYISFMGTYDQTGHLQPFWSLGCRMSDSWILFPPNGSAFSSGYAYSWIASPTCVFPNGAQPDTYVNKSAIWNSYPVTYTSGKTLNTIVSYDFAYPTNLASSQSLDQAVSAEVFYFTKEYGLTRWEAWQSVGNHPNSQPTTPASTGCNGTSTNVWGNGNTMVRIDCHDWSYTQSIIGGTWNPANWTIDPIFTSDTP